MTLPKLQTNTPASLYLIHSHVIEFNSMNDSNLA